MKQIISKAKKPLITLCLQAVLITHHQNFQLAQTVKNYLIQEQNIPEDFISIKEQTEPCETQNYFMHFCVDQNNELKILKLDQERTREIFSRYKNKKGFN